MPSLKIGDISPNFQAKTTLDDIDFYDWLGNSWGVLLSNPADFTPVCTTELGLLTAKLKDEFNRRNVKVIALSVDSIKAHQKWIKDINETQRTRIEFPIIADYNKWISFLYGMLPPHESLTTTVRSVFIIDPDKRIRFMMDYPSTTGRNFNELLRVIDSLQFTDNLKLAM